MLAALGLVALIAFSVEGALGFGSTVLAVSLGAQLVPLDVLLPAFIPVGICLSLSLLRGPIQWRILALEVAPLVGVGIAGGVALSHVLASRALLVAFGAFVVALSAWQLAGPTRRLWPAPLLALGGVVHGLFGTGGPMIVYVTRTKIADKTAFRATLAVLWIALNTVLVVNFVALGHYPRPALALVIGAAVIPGRVLGEYLHRRLDPRAFERAVWCVLLVAGATLAVRSL